MDGGGAKKRVEEKQRERRQKQRETLSQPITLPSGKKGDYEKMRDGLICQRHDAMKESGMFTTLELGRDSALKF